MAEEKKEGFKDRNDVVKKFKVTGDFGWMHLWIAESKADGRKFMRLYRYMNWFAIPNAKYLASVQKLLKKGAEELGWTYGSDKEAIIKEEKSTEASITKSKDENLKVYIPDEIIEFIHNHPKTANKLIELVDFENLDDDDIKYISELLSILNNTILKAGKKLKISFQELIGKISKENDDKSMDKLCDLMDSWSLMQITSLLQIVRKRLNDIDIFEKMIHDEKTYEINTDKSIHRILEKSMWIIDDSYWIVQSNKSLRTFIGDEVEKKHSRKRPDFVCVNHGNKLIILEIKRPSIDLGKEELDQAELYQRIIKRYKGQNYHSIRIILIGNTISDEAREVVELRKNIELKTYQDFLESCRKRYEEYLRVIEK
jgi:hypothetical protein